MLSLNYVLNNKTTTNRKIVAQQSEVEKATQETVEKSLFSISNTKA